MGSMQSDLPARDTDGRLQSKEDKLVGVLIQSSKTQQILFPMCSSSWNGIFIVAAGLHLQTAQVNRRSWFNLMSEHPK